MQGKLNLISPEVWKDQPYDSKSDIWSLGITFAQFLTEKHPFETNDNKEILKILRNFDEETILQN